MTCAQAPRSLATVVLLLGVTACGVEQGCTTIGGTSEVEVTVPAPVRVRLASLRVELCQADRCRDLGFSATPRDPWRSTAYVRRGVVVERGSYRVDLAALGRGWRPDETARLTVSGAGPGGRTLVRRTESFRFTTTYPNGRECDVTPYLSHRVRLGAGDRVG